MLYDRFAESAATLAQHQKRLREKFLPDLDPALGPSFRQQDFLEYAKRHAIIISSNMLQGYIRVGLLPRPMLRSYYSNQHVAMFNIIDRLRELLEIWEIRQLLLPLHEQTNMLEGAPSVAEWLYPYLQRTTGPSRVERLKPLLENLIREAPDLSYLQQERLMRSLADLKDLCEALELARQQFALRKRLERRWSEKRSVTLVGEKAEAEARSSAVAEQSTETIVTAATVRLKRMRK